MGRVVVKSHMKERVPFTWCADFRCVSRSRFWGTPLPIWASKDMKELVVISSIAQLEELTGEKVTSFCTSPSTHGTHVCSGKDFCIGSRAAYYIDCMALPPGVVKVLRNCAILLMLW